jgi:hypothetical protein
MPDFLFIRSEDSSFVAGLRLFLRHPICTKSQRNWMPLFSGFSLLLLPPVAAALFRASLLHCFFSLSSITRHSLSERGTLGMIRQILQRAVTPFFFPAFQVSLFTTHLSSFGYFFWGGGLYGVEGA